ncbi:thioredoxin family protein [Cellulophaga sp. F20128]|uniref:thioredoxin family protein n=1 Tax=Cellulophaga sp. F20128 TaxID=2926413 RepID=UPI001FF2EBD2|nr:thioredoxin family protein [Cellulophaga sp. F20128]MCK0158532.1 thioredoxin family protein [Cellulophaga sp. F20128]
MKHFLIVIAILCSVVVSAQEWSENYTQALEKAADENKPLLIVFSGSDWCGTCIKLDTQIWQSKEFIKYAQQELVLYRADFPRKKKNKLPEKVANSNAEIADKFNPNGYFPFVLLLNKEEEILGKTGYKNVSPSEYIRHLTKFVK